MDMMNRDFQHMIDALSACFARLGFERDERALPDVCVSAAARLSQCDVSQLYLLDEVTGGLELIAQHLAQVPSLAVVPSRPGQHSQQLLYDTLTQGTALSLEDVQGSGHDMGFLPALATPWRALLSVPLFNRCERMTGVLVCARQHPAQLQGYAPSLGHLGNFAVNQLRVLRDGQPNVGTQPECNTPLAGAYGLIGTSAAMEQACRLISKVLNTPYTVLLQGETGTGKEVVARAIHAAGPRKAKAFVVQNCAAFPEGLLESELFGYRKGAFTGAERNHAGLFDTAHGGTLLLDEIGDMPLPLQAKLLRVLQEGEVRPLGPVRHTRSTCASLPRPTATSRRWSPKGAFVKTSITDWLSSPSPCRPCASETAMCCNWRAISRPRCAQRWAGHLSSGRIPPLINCPATVFPATCASSNAWWSAPCCCVTTA